MLLTKQENFDNIEFERYENQIVFARKDVGDLLQNMAYVNLFTRPRRFGKNLNMSMLKYFFEAGSDNNMLLDNNTLFDGLEIAKEKELCRVVSG